MRTHLLIATAVALLIGLTLGAGSSLAQETYAPTPDTNDLGWSSNDVREEPDQPDDDNGFEKGFFSPKDDRLVLDSYTESRFGHDLALSHDEDVSQIVNVLMHGDSSEEYNQYIFPGRIIFKAWWGYWSDTGGFGDFQQNPHTDAALGENTNANGKIDDGSDCEDPEWDEFVWRGANSCAADAGIPEADTSSNMDSIWGFVQPGTHDMHVNTMVVGCSCPDDAFLRSNRDMNHQPDWRYQNNAEAGGQEWSQGNSFARYMYDNSLLISTRVITSVNPQEDPTAPGSGPAFDPLQGAGDATHAHDIDIYSSLDPVVEDAYRTTIWDPPQDYGDNEDEQNIFAGTLSGSDADERGLKGIAKYPVHQAYLDTQDTVFTAVSEAVEPTEPATGVADDAVFGPYFHEPNIADDKYPYADFDAATSYGSLDGYYQPGENQDYTGYQEAEHFWFDAQVGINTCPLWIPSGAPPGQEGTNCYNGWGHFTPEVPSTSSPVDSTTSEGDDNTFGPGVLYWNGNAGTWYDANEDTWVGNPTGDTNESTDDPYNNGNTDDPNQYGSSEFRGSINVNYDVRLVPTEDTDGDGVGEWGTTGVYVLGTFHDGNPYSDVAMDALGDTAQPVGDTLRESPSPVGPAATYTTPDDENGQFSRHRMQGPIDMSPIVAPGQSAGSGTAFSGKAIVFPAGNLDVPFRVESTAELTDKTRLSQHGTNKNDPLKGESVTDIDEYVGILSTNE